MAAGPKGAVCCAWLDLRNKDTEIMASVSNDGGKTWQLIDAGPRNKVFVDSIWRTWDDRFLLKAFQTSITQVGENFFCVPELY